MRNLFILLLLMLFQVPLSLLFSRLLLAVFPAKRTAPGQGTVALSAGLALIVLLLAGCFFLGDSTSAKLAWLIYIACLLGSIAAIYVSVLCVSESGRRFYLMHLVETGDGIRVGELREKYNRDHMLGIRLQRLVAWKVLTVEKGRYRLCRRSAYIYSSFFHIWGRILGFKWF